MSSLSISPAQIEVFFEASRDANPLHREPAYALRTQFGRPVAYGMAAVLRALALGFPRPGMRLRHLRADFRKPLFSGERYDWRVENVAHGTRVRIGRGAVDYAIIQFTPQDGKVATPTDVPADPPAFAPRSAAAAEPQTQARNVEYCVDPVAMRRLRQAFELAADSPPDDQIAALLWSSYHVGMEMPGRQALFADLKIEFTPAPAAAQLRLALQPAEFDDRFNRYSQTGAGPGIGKITLSAFRRPLPVDFPLDTVPAFDPARLPLAGRTAFISGAARGFGAVLARACMRAGAQVAINYRGDAGAAEALCAELLRAGGAARTFAADMGEPASVAALVDALRDWSGAIDLVFDNAAPPIRELLLQEQSDADWLEFVRQNLAITLNSARQLLPLMREGGRFVHVSSKYLAEPVRGFSHYLAAKSAQSGLVRALALEFGRCEFVIARLPRILTDQTNLPFSFDAPRDPRMVAHELLMRLSAPSTGNLRILDLF